MQAKVSRKYRVVNDTGELPGEKGAVVEMTVDDLVRLTGVRRERINRRLNMQHLRLFSRLKMDPATAQRVGRAQMAGQMKGETVVRQADSEKRRAHEERVRKGHRSL